MTINRNLSILAEGASSSGVLGTANGGTNSTATPTAGGVIYGTGTALAPTAAGTSGQVLTSAGTGTPTWTTPSSGAMTLISTVTANNTSQYITFTNISGYSNYLLIFNNIRITSGGSNPYLYFGTGSTPTWQTSGYSWVLNVSYSGTQALNQSSAGSGIILGFNGLVASTTRGMVGQVLIGNLNSAYSKTAIASVSFYNNGNSWTNLSSTGEWLDSTVATAIRIDFSTTLISGTASLYGISS